MLPTFLFFYCNRHSFELRFSSRSCWFLRCFWLIFVSSVFGFIVVCRIDCTAQWNVLKSWIRTIVHLAILIDIYEQNCACLHRNWMVMFELTCLNTYLLLSSLNRSRLWCWCRGRRSWCQQVSAIQPLSKPIAVANLIHRNLSRFSRDVIISQTNNKCAIANQLKMVFRRPQRFMPFFSSSLKFLLHLRQDKNTIRFGIVWTDSIIMWVASDKV